MLSPPSSGVKLPEEVVEEQLKCFQEGDIMEAFQSYMSDEAKVIFDNSWKVFTSEFDEEPFYPIVEHAKATVLMTILGRETYEEEVYTAVSLILFVSSSALLRNWLFLLDVKFRRI